MVVKGLYTEHTVNVESVLRSQKLEPLARHLCPMWYLLLDYLRLWEDLEDGVGITITAC